MGRSSPIWEPRLAYVCSESGFRHHLHVVYVAVYLDLREDVFSDVENLAERHGMLLSLLGDSMLSSVRACGKNL
jgi:hypothetical protein